MADHVESFFESLSPSRRNSRARGADYEARLIVERRNIADGSRAHRRVCWNQRRNSSTDGRTPSR